MPTLEKIAVSWPLFVCAVMVPWNGAAIAQAQPYPAKPIRIITTDPAGAADIAARLIAPTLTANLGQQVIIDNRPGAGSITSIETVARSVPDGYTLLLHGSPVWLMQFMRANLPWDPLRDLAPVSLATTLPNVKLAGGVHNASTNASSHSWRSRRRQTRIQSGCLNSKP